MRKVMLVVALAAAASGCRQHWVRAGATSADFEREKMICRYEAEKATAMVTGVAGGIEMVRIMDLCLQARGWRLSG